MKNNLPLISVIIPTYNRKEYIKDAIDSVLAQTYENFEIIVVDDGSTDDTKRSLTSLDLPIKIISKENGGAASARNVGVKESSGEYIAFLDSDDIWLPEKLHLQMEYFDHNPQAGLVYTDTFNEVDGKIDELTRFSMRPPRTKMQMPAFVNIVPIQTSTVVMKKKIFEEIGRFNERLEIHEDSDLWNRVSDKCGLDYINEPLVTYRWHNEKDNLMNPRNKQKQIDNSKRYLEIYKLRKGRNITPEEQRAIDESYRIIEIL